MTTKTCTKCGETLDLAEFTKDRAKASGHGSRCKPCHRKAVNDRARRTRTMNLTTATKAVREVFAATSRPASTQVETRIDWRHRAACRGVDPELFHPVGAGPDAQAQILLAKAVCRRCPVAQRCGDLALIEGYAGVWGGLSDDDRRELRPDFKPKEEPQPCGTEAALKAHDRAGERCETCRRAGSLRRAEQRMSA